MVYNICKQPLAIDRIFLLFLYHIPLFCLLIPQPIAVVFLVTDAFACLPCFILHTRYEDLFGLLPIFSQRQTVLLTQQRSLEAYK